MPSWSIVSQSLGGLGLFLLGMWLLTEGLKLAGGSALRQILSHWTITRLRSFLSGFSLTAIVQSSSAVTVSVIGFINAGLLDLSRSLWIIFGSNVGTTMTAWIVALIGFKFKIDVLALPAIGIGAMFHLFSSRSRYKALGGALAGLGLLFLGLQVLQTAFSDAAQVVDLSKLYTGGLLGTLVMVLIGLVLTALMQSSSAAMAIVLTAVATKVLPLDAGAAAVIGANVGTTVTAIIAVLKATANARRVAVAHVIFNVITAAVALALLGAFLALVQWLQHALQLDANAAVSLALFHTIFNLLGVVLMIPLEPRLTRWLLRLFTHSEAQVIKPQFLDSNIISVPDLALNAALLDQRRVVQEFELVFRKFQAGDPLAGEHIANLRGLILAINEYVVQCSQQQMSAETAVAFQRVIEINLRLSGCLDYLEETAGLAELKAKLIAPLQAEIGKLEAASMAIVASCATEMDTHFPNPDVKQSLLQFERSYRDSRQLIVDDARQRELSAEAMQQLLKQLTTLRRLTRQFYKACRASGELNRKPAAPLVPTTEAIAD